MTDARVERRLAAILAADVVGFSALMERDEEGTYARVGRLRREVIEPRLSDHQGRLIKTTGDGFLVEFASPIAALRCALAIQSSSSNAPDALRLRIGLNLGDVIIEESGDVYGEGVNVAVRLEALADPGGILISGKIHGEVEGKVEADFEDRGEQQVKNITRPVRIYAARPVGAASRSAATNLSQFDPGKPLPLPDKPSIAVLPFQNMSGDPEQEYFADGIVEDIITALSQFKSLFVIARNSSFTYKGKAADIKQVGRELGVRYVLEGSVRNAAGRVRITGQLIDAITGAHLWADRFEGSLENIFDLQDQVASGVVGAIDPRIWDAEIARTGRKPVADLSAYDCFLRAMEHTNKWTTEGVDESLRFLYRAIELDSTYAEAYALATWTFVWRSGLRALSPDERREAERLAREAARLGKDDGFCLAWAGFTIAAICGEFQEGAALIDRALELNPNLARSWNLSGWIRLWLGQPEIAIEHLARAMRLSPMDPAFHLMEYATASAHFRAGRYDEAVRWAEKSLRRQPNFGAAYALALIRAAAGDIEGARRAVQRLLQIQPSSRISNSGNQPYISAERRAWYRDLLRQAGLPE